ncbi:MAG TPA: PAS domain S-box protein [Syntrophomonadaceae bacterium]|nr:PAS domain S-box protein [Syntrophomonadaceae bacterium]
MKDKDKRKAHLKGELAGLHKEIIKRQHAEEKLLAERQRLFSVLDGLPAQVYLIAPDHSFRFSNRFFQERFGKPGDDPCYKVFHNRTEPCEQCSTFTAGKIEIQQGEWTYPDGYTYEVYDYPFIDVDGTELLLSFGLDVTECKKVELELSRSEEKFSKAFRSNPDWMTISNLREGRYIEINDAALSAIGYQRDEVIGHTVQELGIWAFPEERDLLLEQIQEHGNVRNLETTFRMKAGEIRNFLISAEIIDIGGEPYLLGVSKDITRQRIIEERLRESEAELRTIFENANGIIYTLSTEGKFIFVSRGWTENLGHDVREVKDQFFGSFIHTDDIPICKDFLERVIATGEPLKGVEYRVKHLDGTWRWHTSSGAPVKDEAGSSLYYVGLAVDITERKKAEEEIKYLSFHDKLTGLYNRAYFEEALKRIDTPRQLPISLIMGDVNGLKLINDVLGHQEGDTVLKTVAEILRKSCRQEDIVARWGGDEFIILLPGCDLDIASRISDRIKNACKHINDLPIETSLSVGLASKNNITHDIKVIIKEAEDKMYRNKLLETRSTRSSFLTSLEKTLWTRSHETQAHCQRMQEMAQNIAQAIDLHDSELDNVKLLAVLHDIGKIAIPNTILDKPEKLSLAEWESIKKHPEIGYRIALSSPEMAPIAEAILHHHERWDGTGYPLGLKGEEIPLICRIIAIVDTYDVMLNGRPYQKAVSRAEAWMEIKRCAGSQFDPDLVRKAIELFAEE